MRIRERDAIRTDMFLHVAARQLDKLSKYPNTLHVVFTLTLTLSNVLHHSCIHKSKTRSLLSLTLELLQNENERMHVRSFKKLSEK